MSWTPDPSFALQSNLVFPKGASCSVTSFSGDGPRLVSADNRQAGMANNTGKTRVTLALVYFAPYVTLLLAR